MLFFAQGIKTCQDSPIGHDSLKYVFYCPSCDGVLTIWFRLTVSPPFLMVSHMHVVFGIGTITIPMFIVIDL